MEEMVVVNEHGDHNLDFQVFTHTLLTRWLYPPNNQPPANPGADLEAPAAPMTAPPEEGDLLVFALPIEPIDPLIRVGNPPARIPSPPRSPPPPRPPTPQLPNPTPTPPIDIPSPIRYKRTVRISVISSLRNPIRLAYPLNYHKPSSSTHDSDPLDSSSSSDDSSSDSSGRSYESDHMATGCVWRIPHAHSLLVEPFMIWCCIRLVVGKSPRCEADSIKKSS